MGKRYSYRSAGDMSHVPMIAGPSFTSSETTGVTESWLSGKGHHRIIFIWLFVTL
ncbi:hypothetical protein Csa_007497 [Cucumis sativus]|uniref:Uncharacterized protein n=1 Tax=Cucumis sativus TaxID=3659 RepID=A0A0A0LWH5_CUCSA|nr:hypothetical protein Csa_007497 [Cucumis sativus]